MNSKVNYVRQLCGFCLKKKMRRQRDIIKKEHRLEHVNVSSRDSLGNYFKRSRGKIFRKV